MPDSGWIPDASSRYHSAEGFASLFDPLRRTTDGRCNARSVQNITNKELGGWTQFLNYALAELLIHVQNGNISSIFADFFRRRPP
jgi:uncharacterized membrane-anchored protein